MPVPVPRVAILGLHLEANAFAPVTELTDFTQQCLEEGAAITTLARSEVSHLPSEFPGFYKRMDATGPWHPVPILVAASPPGGPIAQDVFTGFLDAMRAGLAAALPLDAVYLGSHGAASATGDEDPDGTIAAMIRQVVGPAVPIAVSHDLHCNVSERLVTSVDAFVGYRTNPHVDMAARAAECADLIRAMLDGLRPVRHFIRLPMVPPTVTLLTKTGPYADLIKDAEAAMRDDPAVLNASVTGGFVYTDLPKCGLCITITARDATTAEATAKRLATRAWNERGRHTRTLLSVAEAASLAVAAGEGRESPVIFSDAGDNPGGGGRGSTSWLLKALHEAGAQGVVMGNFIDPELAAEAHRVGEGASFDAVFNRAESEFSKRFAVKARVVACSDGRGVGRRGTMAGRAFNLGPAALLELEGSGLRVVVASLRRQLLEPRMLEMFGIDIAAARCVVVKSRGHFRAGFDEFFPDDRIFEVDAPGLTSPVLANFSWKRLPRPVFPLDAEASWAG